MYILWEMSKSVYYFLDLSQLSYPKSISCYEFDCFINDKYYPSQNGFENLQCNAYENFYRGFMNRHPYYNFNG